MPVLINKNSMKLYKETASKPCVKEKKNKIRFSKRKKGGRYGFQGKVNSQTLAKFFCKLLLSKPQLFDKDEVALKKVCCFENLSRIDFRQFSLSQIEQKKVHNIFTFSFRGCAPEEKFSIPIFFFPRRFRQKKS